MSKFLEKSSPAWIAHALLLGSVLLVTACQADDPADYVDPQSTAFYNNYPIKVRQAQEKVGIAAHGDSLQPEQVNAIANFAADARNNGGSKVWVKWPSGSGKARQAAGEIAQLLVDGGVPQSMVRVTSYPGGASAPMQLSFERAVAVTRECGDWSDNLANDRTNGIYRNHGCAVQNNLAALVANPDDFEHPRAMSAAVAANRTAAMKIYLDSATTVTSSTQSGNQTSSTSTTSSTGG